MNRFATIMLLFLGITSCATTDLPPIETHGKFQLAEDEQRIWKEAEEDQKKLEKSGWLYDNPSLVAYVNQVLQKLIPEHAQDKGFSFQVRVVKNPLLNACASPNGVIYIHTGILAKMENEAQLATILGHEIVHAINRHGVRQFRNMKNTTAFLATLQVVAAPAGVYGSSAVLLGAVGALASVSGYSREFEREADKEGLELMVRAGYDPQEAPKLFDHLKRELEERDVTEPFFFGRHPRLQERKDTYGDLLQSSYAGKKGEKSTERFMEHILPLLLDNALLDIAMGRFGLAEETIQRFLHHEPRSARAHHYMGELYRQRDQEGDIVKAEKEYHLAVQYNPSFPEARKGLGLIYLKQGQKEKSKAEFEKYLALAPQPEDRGYIEQYLQDIHAKGTEQ